MILAVESSHHWCCSQGERSRSLDSLQGSSIQCVNVDCGLSDQPGSTAAASVLLSTRENSDDSKTKRLLLHFVAIIS